MSGMKRTNTNAFPFFDEETLRRKLSQSNDSKNSFGTLCCEESLPALGSCSDLLGCSDETETECSSLSCSDETESTKGHVSFNDSVSVRIVYCNSDDDDDKDDEEKNEDSFTVLKKEDNSRPIYEAVHFDEKEEAIRSQLEGCICATRRKKPNYAAMYGCGKSISDDDDDFDDDDSDDDEFDFDHPARVIVCTTASWL